MLFLMKMLFLLTYNGFIILNGLMHFYWCIIALHCCFCYITQSESCRYVYLHPLPPEPPSHLSPHPTLSIEAERRVRLPVLYSTFPLAIYFIHDRVYMSMLLSQFIPPSPSSCVHMSILYICVSIPALKILSSVPSFQIPHKCINI